MKFEQIAEFALGPTPIPSSALNMAALLLIDTLGVAAGAAQMQAGRIAREHVFQFHAAHDAEHSATLLFDGRKSSIPGAAFALATQIDNLDAHDGYNPTKGHIGCAVVPALCAIAEQQPDLSAHDALTALAIAYEVAARAGLALHATVSDYHTSGAWNALGVAALGCRLRKANKDALRQAFGIAEYHGPRSQMMREIANPSMLHDGSGMGAMVGCMAVLMAEQKFMGAPAATVESDDICQHWAELGEVWTIEHNYIKPYPICRWAHAAIDGLGRLIDEHALHADDVKSIEIRTFSEAAALYPGMPTTTSQAQYSLAFALAIRLVHGQIAAEHITGKGLQDSEVARSLEKITVQEDARHSERFPIGRWSDVTVQLMDGSTLSSGDVHARGGPEAPMTEQEIEAKFISMSHGLGRERSKAIWSMHQQLLEPGVSFSKLLCLLHPAGKTSMAKSPRIVLHNDKTKELANKLRETCESADFLECNSYQDLPQMVSEFRPEILYTVRFAGSDRYPRARLFSSDGPRWIANGGAGTDHFGKWDPARVTVTNAAGVAADMMAEYVMGSFLHFTLNIPGFQADKSNRQWSSRTVSPLRGKTILIIGLGHTGEAIAVRAKAFSMHVLGTRARPQAMEHVDEIGTASELQNFLPRADFVAVSTPLTAQTRGLIGPIEFSILKPGAVLADVSRGGVVDQTELRLALEDGRLAGAALDVFETEPLPESSPLWQVENLIISPHCSSVYDGWADASFDLFLDNLKRWMEGVPLNNVVDPARGY